MGDADTPASAQLSQPAEFRWSPSRLAPPARGAPPLPARSLATHDAPLYVAYSEDRQQRAPPSPLALPGGWSGPTRARSADTSGGDGLRWRLLQRADSRGTGEHDRNAEDEQDDDEEDEALFLPPPFLAHDSPRESFDGLLGARLARTRSRQQRAHERLLAQGRAPPPPFPGSLVTAALKVARVLGPPGGYDAPRPMRERARERDEKGKGKGKGLSLDEAAQLVEDALRNVDAEGAHAGRQEEERQRRRVQRAVSGLRAYEVGAEMGRKVAGRLVRHRSRRDASAGDTDSVEAVDEGVLSGEQVFISVTPSQLLGSPPSLPADTRASFPDDDEVPPLPPSAPSLRPLSIPDLPPLPIVSTPLMLEPAALDDYFGLRRRSSLRRASLSATSPVSPRNGAASFVSSDLRRPFRLHSIPHRATSTSSSLIDLLIFVLIGSPPSPSSAGLDVSLASVGGLIGMLVHTVGFVFFVIYHTSALVAASVTALRMTATFLYWAGMNLTGRTQVAKAVVEYWRACRVEWDRVWLEENEERLSAWSVVKGLAELAALQSMTHARWLQEGPGQLALLNDDVPTENGLATPRFGPQRRKHSLHVERPSITQRHRSFLWARDGDAEDGEGMVITSQNNGVLVGSLISRDEPSPVDNASLVRGSYLSRQSPFPEPSTIDQLLEEEPPPFDLEPAAEPYHFPISPPLQPVREASDRLAELVALIKRCCRLSTASYGLHTLIPSPPTPLLTPSGQTLPQRVFAHLGGVGDHRDVLHVAIQRRYTGLETTQDDEGEAIYAPQLFLLRDDVRGEIVVVFRGTQSLADLRTDLDSSFVSVDLPQLPTDTPVTECRATPSPNDSPLPRSSYRIHSGILNTAQHLLSLSPSSITPSPLLPKLRTTLESHPRYSLVLTGHSLGAALASTVALLLGAWDPSTASWVVRPDAGLDEGAWRRPLRAVCFAHPTTLNAPLAARCAFPPDDEGTPLVLNVSLGADVICRMGIPHVREVRRAVGRLARMRRTRAVDAEPGVISAWKAWRGAVGIEDNVVVKRWEGWAWRARAEAEGWARDEDATEDDVDTAIPAGRAYHIDRLPPELEQRRRRELEGEEEDERDLWGLYEVRDPKRFYALPLLRGDLLKSHMPKDYLEACEAL